MRLFLVRHGQSLANQDCSVNTNMADHAIPLTGRGVAQAQEAGKFLASYFHEKLVQTHSDGHRIPLIRLWVSPYLRTRQTAREIEEYCRVPSTIKKWDWVRSDPKRSSFALDQILKPQDSWFLDRREHPLLAEQQFGIFDGLSDEQREALYPREHAYYEKCRRAEGKFWPKMPLGESRFDVAQRVHQAFGTFHRDCERRGIEDLVIVAHGTVNRAIVMMWLHKPYEWMHHEPNPKNCSVRLIEGTKDKGYIFEGFDSDPPKINKETEE